MSQNWNLQCKVKTMPGELDSLLYHEFQGCKFAYRLRGQGPPIVFIQGTGVHGDGWNPQIDQLQQQFSCLSFDNRGMGQSLPLPKRLTVEQMALDTLALMDCLNWQSAHLVGHSLGGLIAQSVAIAAPERVRSLSLLCTFSRGADATKLTWKMFWTGLRTYIGTRQMRRRAFCEIVLPPSLWSMKDQWANQLEPLFGHDLADQPRVVMKQLSAMKNYDATAQLSKINHLPTLIVGAKFDPIARPEVIDKLAWRFPSSRVIKVDHASHGLPIHSAAEVNQLLVKHITAIESPEKPRRPHHRPS